MINLLLRDVTLNNVKKNNTQEPQWNTVRRQEWGVPKPCNYSRANRKKKDFSSFPAMTQPMKSRGLCLPEASWCPLPLYKNFLLPLRWGRGGLVCVAPPGRGSRTTALNKPAFAGKIPGCLSVLSAQPSLPSGAGAAPRMRFLEDRSCFLAQWCGGPAPIGKLESGKSRRKHLSVPLSPCGPGVVFRLKSLHGR